MPKCGCIEDNLEWNMITSKVYIVDMYHWKDEGVQLLQ